MAEFIKAGETQTEKFTYSPGKNYRWQPDDKFILTGLEFGAILTALRGYSKDPEFIKVANTLQALEVAERIFISAVEAGIAKEEEPPIGKTLPPDETMYS